MNRDAKNANSAKAVGRLRLRLSATAESLVRGGHPWVFADSVREQSRAGLAGELAVVYDRNDKFLALGFFDPVSPIRLRVLHVGKPVEINRAFWSERLQIARAKRAPLFDAETTGYRVINGESDGWPGLVLDRYGEVWVLKLYATAWVERLPEIAALIREQLSPDGLVLRLSRNVQKEINSRTIADGQWLIPPPPGLIEGNTVTFLERGLRLEANVVQGQKTGFFLDQRDNRQLVEGLAAGQSVLNAFSFSGGFSLSAARGGASLVTDLDISSHALESARRNFKLNSGNERVAACRHQSVQADAFEWLEQRPTRRYHLVVVDPPSLAKREAERSRAIGAYEKLARASLKHLSRDGILVACSCSAHVSADEFFEAVRRAARAESSGFQELQTTRHAPDHPATFKEAEYLKAIYLKVGRG